MYPQDYKYSEEHEWLQNQDDVVVVGITEFAAEELGDVVYVELPEVGKVFEAEDEVGTIESVKAVAEIYTPVSGEVVAVNDALEGAPDRVNADPHGEGWLFRLRPSSPDELERLMTSEAYETFIQSKS